MDKHLATQTQIIAKRNITPISGNELQRQCACGQHSSAGGECEECKKEPEGMLQRAAINPSPVHEVPTIVHEVLRSPGQPLDPEMRAYMEPRFGHDFSKVRVHTGAKAAESAQAVNALAYTVGGDMVFGRGQYVPATTTGRKLIAHELTHITQQTAANRAPPNALSIGDKHSVYETEADATAESIISGAPVLTPSPMLHHSLQRDAPIDRERSSSNRLTADVNNIDFSLRFSRGRHRFAGRVQLSNPISLVPLDRLGLNLALDPAILSSFIGYENPCNDTIQSALVNFRSGPFVGVDRIPWQLEAGTTLRFGDTQITPGGRISFLGSDFDTFFLTLTLVSNVDRRIPERCRRTPEPTPEPEAPRGSRDREPPTHRPGSPDDIPGTTEPPHPAELSPMTLYFFYDSIIHRPESYDSFQLLLSTLQILPTVHGQLTGHASQEGTTAYNLRLSRQRVDAVRDALVLKGIDRSRLQTLAAGESIPAVPEPDVAEISPELENVRNMNRRVEIEFFDPTGRFGPRVPQLRLRTPYLRLPSLGRTRRPGLHR